MPTNYPDRPQAHLYTKHDHADGYTVDPGVFVIPLAVDEPTNAAELAEFVPFVTVQAYCPITYRTAGFESQKDGAPPQTIPPQDQGAFKFLGGTLNIPSPQKTINGMAHSWLVGGEYQYAVAGATSLIVQKGMAMQSNPLPTVTQYALSQQHGTSAQTNDLVLSQCGDDVKACYNEAQSVSFTGTSYTYYGTTLFPGQFFNTSLLIGNTLFTNPG